jgi:hypothetical protein
MLSSPVLSLSQVVTLEIAAGQKLTTGKVVEFESCPRKAPKLCHATIQVVIH